MRSTTVLLLVALCFGSASARCANDCMGQGICNEKNQCECFRNFYGFDCSQRLCQFGRAFVDSPIGDANGDNDVSVQQSVKLGRANLPATELFDSDYGAARSSLESTSSWDEAHFWRECSGKGNCDSTSGLCQCFPGFEGGACARTSCPKGCSGRGQCKTYEGTSYSAWDKEKTSYCDCDKGYEGPGCESRVCPSGIDPVESSNYDTSRFQHIAFRGFDKIAKFNDGNEFQKYPFGDVQFTLTLTDEFGDEWTTEAITIHYARVGKSSDGNVYPVPTFKAAGKNSRTHVATQVKDALEALPHNAAGKVVVHELYVRNDDSSSSTAFPTQAWNDRSRCGGHGACSFDGCGAIWENANYDDKTTSWDNTKTRKGASSYATGSCGVAASTQAPVKVPAGSLTGRLYYQWPYYQTHEACGQRFPLFANGANNRDGIAWKNGIATYLGDAKNNILFGLNLFIRFEKSTITSNLRVDYTFKNNNPLLQSQTTSAAINPVGKAQEGFYCNDVDNNCGTTTGEVTDEIGLVSVFDRTHLRRWDEFYCGEYKNFLKESLSMKPMLHRCSKRGVCNYDTGLCKCFAGYTGNACGQQNALASG